MTFTRAEFDQIRTLVEKKKIQEAKQKLRMIDDPRAQDLLAKLMDKYPESLVQVASQSAPKTPEMSKPSPRINAKRSYKIPLLIVSAILVLGLIAFFAYQQFKPVLMQSALKTACHNMIELLHSGHGVEEAKIASACDYSARNAWVISPSGVEQCVLSNDVNDMYKLLDFNACLGSYGIQFIDFSPASLK